MANDSIEQVAATDGQTTQDNVLKKQVVREILYKQAGNLSVGTQVVSTTTFSTLDVQFNYPGEMSAEYPVGQDSTTDRDRINWNRFDMSLRRGQSRYFINDSAKLRGVGNMQQQFTQRRSGEAMARRKDENILGTLRDGAVSENTDSFSNGGELDQDDVDAVDRLHGMWTDILVNAPVNNTNIEEMVVILPIEIWTELNQVELINNVQQQLKEYLGQTFGFSLFPTKLGLKEDDKIDLQDTAIMLIPGEETAIHGVLSEEAADEAGVPLVEESRVTGQGEEYLVNQWFNTSVLEHESGTGNETPRIAVRNNVNSNR